MIKTIIVITLILVLSGCTFNFIFEDNEPQQKETK